MDASFILQKVYSIWSITLQVFKFPGSSVQVLSSALILIFVRMILGALSSFIPPAPTIESSLSSILTSFFPSSTATSVEPVPIAIGGDGGPSNAKAENEADEPGNSKLEVRREESEAAMEGVKYEGYSEAIASAQGQVQRNFIMVLIYRH